MANQFHHVMIDLETMGNKNRAAICTIGAIEFDISSGVKGREFYEKIDLQSCLDLGLQIDGSTVRWWMGQPDQARNEIIQDGRNIHQVLFKLNHWFAACHPGYQVWGNGSSFDLVILESAFEAVGQQAPWDFRNERDVRTMLMLYPNVKDYVKHRGIKHHALSDCRYQIELVSEVFRLATSRNDVMA
jgi:hypothetical protein